MNFAIATVHRGRRLMVVAGVNYKGGCMLKNLFFAVFTVTLLVATIWSPICQAEFAKEIMTTSDLAGQTKEILALRQQVNDLELKVSEYEKQVAQMEALNDFTDKKKVTELLKATEDQLDQCKAGLWRQRQILNTWDNCYPSADQEGIGVKTPCEKQ